MKKNKLIVALLLCTIISTPTFVEGRMVNPDHVSSGISDSSIIDDNGGAVYVDAGETIINGNNIEFSRNSAQNGGAIYNAADMHISGATFSDNSASENGGAIYNAANLDINGVTFSDNNAQNGGAIYNASNCTINMSDVTVNAANGTALNDIYNDGTINANNTNNFNSNISGSGSLVNTGTMNLGGGTLSDTIQMTISNGSTLNVAGGTANLGSNDTWNGTVKLQSGTLNVDDVSGALNATGGNYNLSGTSTLGTGSSVANEVTTNLNSGSTLNIAGGRLNLNSGDTWDGTVNLTSGTLCVDGVSGTLNATDGSYMAYGTINIGAGSVIGDAVEVYINHTTNLNITGGTVDIGSEDHLLDGMINLSSGTLNVHLANGNGLNATGGNYNVLGNTVLYTGSNVASAVVTNISSGATLINDGGTLNLDSNDTWNGQIVNDNNNSIINTDNFVSNSSTASFVQNNGTLNLTNGSELKLNTGSAISGGIINIQKDKVDSTEGTAGSVLTANGNVITGGEMNIDKYSQFALKSGQFNIDVLNANGSDAVNAALINTMNGEIATSTIGTLSIDNQANFNIDIHARSNANNGNDKFIITDGDITGGGTAHIQDWALNGDIYGWDAPIDRHIKLGNIFENTDGNALQTGITVTDKTVFTPIGWYQLNKNEEYEEVYEEFENPGDSANQISGGTMTRNHIGSNYTLDLVKYNPQVFRGQVVTVAQWMNQLNIADLLFTHSMVLPSFKEEDGIANKSIMANRYAAESPIYAPYQYSRKDGGLWYKAYGTFENLQMNNGLSRVGNNSYGALVGADLGLRELRNGWKFMPTAYLGYNGAHQTFANVGAYQNGGQLGFLGTWYKDKFIVGTTVYSGVYNNSMDVFGHNDDTVNYFAGTSAKAAYNIRLGKDWVLQPNLFVSYNYFGQQNWHTNFGQMGMMAGDLHGVNIAPGMNLIWEKDTFSTYATLQYMYNINGAVGGRAGNVNLPQMEMERGYIQYGLGFVKKFTDRASGYLQAVLRNVGRTGVGFQMGFNIFLGK